MEATNQSDYNIFTALVETIHSKDRGRLQFVKCEECKRLTPYRLNSVPNMILKCKKCGTRISVRKEH
jgi:translation initiation factor 2 beta subunit (eIF-2beta)/eIF-5